MKVLLSLILRPRFPSEVTTLPLVDDDFGFRKINLNLNVCFFFYTNETTSQRIITIPMHSGTQTFKRFVQAETVIKSIEY